MKANGGGPGWWFGMGERGRLWCFIGLEGTGGKREMDDENSCGGLKGVVLRQL
jgi:hypothetical protein